MDLWLESIGYSSYIQIQMDSKPCYILGKSIRNLLLEQDLQ